MPQNLPGIQPGGGGIGGLHEPTLNSTSANFGASLLPSGISSAGQQVSSPIPNSNSTNVGILSTACKSHPSSRSLPRQNANTNKAGGGGGSASFPGAQFDSPQDTNKKLSSVEQCSSNLHTGGSNNKGFNIANINNSNKFSGLNSSNQQNRHQLQPRILQHQIQHQQQPLPLTSLLRQQHLQKHHQELQIHQQKLGQLQSKDQNHKSETQSNFRDLQIGTQGLPNSDKICSCGHDCKGKIAYSILISERLYCTMHVSFR